MTEPANTAATFSVIMPVYNHAAWVAEAIGSVREQSRPDWELIVVDDGSTDGSGEIADAAAAADPRITVLRQVNAGPAVARNTAIAAARADWLTYLDSDDVWYPDTLAAYGQAIEAHGDERFFHGRRDRLGEDGSVTQLTGRHQDRPTGTAELWERMYLSHLCVCYRRELFEAAGGYDPALRSCEDYELYLRMSLGTRFFPLGRSTGLRRRHGRNISRQSGFSRLQEAGVLRRFIERQGGADAVAPDRVARRLGRLYYAAARQYFKAGCFAQAARAAAEAHRYRRTVKSTLVALVSNALRFIPRDDGRGRPDL